MFSFLLTSIKVGQTNQCRQRTTTHPLLLSHKFPISYQQVGQRFRLSDDFDHEPVSLVLILIVPQRLAGAAQKGALDEECTEANVFIVGCDGPRVVGPVTCVFRILVAYPGALLTPPVKLATRSELEHLVGVVLFKDCFHPEGRY